MVGRFLGGMAITLIALGITTSLLRYRLYDADRAISRSVAFGALTLALLAVFAGSEKIIEVLGEEYFGESLGALAGGIGAAIAAVMIAPLHHRVTHWAEHRFQGALIKLRTGLPLLVGDMRETATPTHLAEVLLDRVESGVRASRGAIVIDSKVAAAKGIAVDAVQEWLGAWVVSSQVSALDCDRTDTLFPLRAPLYADGVGMVGWLLLGGRPDGSFYGKDERVTIATISEPTARALAIALQRAAREAARAEEIGALRGEIGDLRAIVARLGSHRRAGFRPAAEGA
ncbi:hypothetical protein EAH84_05510 [Sphingomonas oligophenolica]|uniref:Uncharacterized protein n=1 Tax=Sphingomonas oligophenolica TaxID=301154 RepID=A0A502CK89_9SPHN|nr:hypothetical protein EAH84_05510 [Sphingomonas oligophenolica]